MGGIPKRVPWCFLQRKWHGINRPGSPSCLGKATVGMISAFLSRRFSLRPRLSNCNFAEVRCRILNNRAKPVRVDLPVTQNVGAKLVRLHSLRERIHSAAHDHSR